MVLPDGSGWWARHALTRLRNCCQSTPPPRPENAWSSWPMMATKRLRLIASISTHSRIGGSAVLFERRLAKPSSRRNAVVGGFTHRSEATRPTAASWDTTRVRTITSSKRRRRHVRWRAAGCGAVSGETALCSEIGLGGLVGRDTGGGNDGAGSGGSKVVGKACRGGTSLIPSVGRSPTSLIEHSYGVSGG